MFQVGEIHQLAFPLFFGEPPVEGQGHLKQPGDFGQQVVDILPELGPGCAELLFRQCFDHLFYLLACGLHPLF